MPTHTAPEILLNHSEFKRKAMGMQLAIAASAKEGIQKR